MPKKRWVRVGAVAVDSGTMVIGDPGYVEPLDYESLIGPCRTEADWQPRELEAVEGTAATFVRLSNFGGDGAYTVYVRCNEEGEVVTALISFDGIRPS